jgi:tyrosyl-tRNA synthetase
MELLEELKWRGLLQDHTPGLEELLAKKKIRGYAGFDPTADSLHIGNLVPVMLLLHFQRYGHHPVVLMGGATGMIGDPSGKSEERKLLSVEDINHNLTCQKKQLERFLDFEGVENKAQLVNNADWFSDMKFLHFLRDVGKHITISYMMSKDSVRTRLESGISFAEFSYQLVQGFDFFYLKSEKDVAVQMGGSDQWGNMLTGTELIRRKSGEEAHAFTAPLITKSDGTKFGKSEGGNIWLDSKRTSPYKFYQYWLNISDEDAARYIKIFSLKTMSEIEKLIENHNKEPHLRVLQKELASEITERIHSKKELDSAISASTILFGQSTREELISISSDQLQDIFSDVPQFTLARTELEKGIQIVNLLTEYTTILSSKGEARRMLTSNAVSLNKEKVDENKVLTKTDLVNNRYIIVQRGKKNYYLISVTD